jgi:hypothetical protein
MLDVTSVFFRTSTVWGNLTLSLALLGQVQNRRVLATAALREDPANLFHLFCVENCQS